MNFGCHGWDFWKCLDVVGLRRETERRRSLSYVLFCREWKKQFLYLMLAKICPTWIPEFVWPGKNRVRTRIFHLNFKFRHHIFRISIVRTWFWHEFTSFELSDQLLWWLQITKYVITFIVNLDNSPFKIKIVTYKISYIRWVINEIGV